MPGPHHLDHHLAAIGKRGRVHLRDGGRGQRLGIESWNNSATGLPRAFSIMAWACFAREWRHLVLQYGQFVGDIRRQQVTTGGQYLPEFHIHRAQFLQRQAQAFASRAAGVAARAG